MKCNFRDETSNVDRNFDMLLARLTCRTQIGVLAAWYLSEEDRNSEIKPTSTDITLFLNPVLQPGLLICQEY